MARRIARWLILLAMIVVGLLLCLDVAYLVHGSLEWYPTEEQEEKIRRVTSVLAAVLIASELGLWWVLRQLRRGTIRPERATDNAAPPPPDGTPKSPRP